MSRETWELDALRRSTRVSMVYTSLDKFESTFVKGSAGSRKELAGRPLRWLASLESGHGAALVLLGHVASRKELLCQIAQL